MRNKAIVAYFKNYPSILLLRLWIVTISVT
jgi:hypothetical protein